MKKYLLLSLLFFSHSLFAEPAAEQQTKAKYDPFFVPIDILLFRPIGLATTLASTALFIAVSPITALSAIAPPHDAFARTADVFIVLPATYTFIRPVGDKRFTRNYD